MTPDDLKRMLAARERFAPDAAAVRATVLAGIGAPSPTGTLRKSVLRNPVLRTPGLRTPLVLAVAVVVLTLAAGVTVAVLRATAPPATPPPVVTPVPATAVPTDGSVATTIMSGPGPGSTATVSQGSAVQESGSGSAEAPRSPGGTTEPSSGTTGSSSGTTGSSSGTTGSSSGTTESPSGTVESAAVQSESAAGQPATGEPPAGTVTSPSRGLNQPESHYLLVTRLQRVGVGGLTGDHPWGGRADVYGVWNDRWIYAAQSMPEFGPKSYSDPAHIDDIEIMGLPVEVIQSLFSGLTLYFACGEWVYDLAVAEPGLEFFAAKSTELDPAIELATLFIEDLACAD